MNFTNDDSILVTRFKTLWEAGPYTAIPVSYPASPVEPVNGKLVKLSIGKAPTVSSAVGNMRNRNFGTLAITVILPTGDGTGELTTICDFVGSFFKAFRSGGLICRPASMFGPFEEGALIRGGVDVSFLSDYTP